MAKFKQIPQTFLYRKLLKFWGNMVKNFDGDCRDDDFFDVVRNCFDHDKAVELIEAAYTPAELAEMSKARSRACRLDLSEPLDDVFNALWNNEGSRDKCQAVLDAAREYMEADCKGRGDDVVSRRFGELKRVLKLDDLESEILVFAYVRDQTCFSWPIRVEDREKPMYYAMALDRSYDEVTRAMTPQGKLLKLGLLDNDYDFSRRTLGGFMDGTSKETIERRFYAKSEGKDVLPWEFFGDLSAKDGEVLKRMVAASGGKCNILLYGAPGTGKTSFARSLARELGRTAFEIRQGDEDGKNMKSEARMVGIQVCNGQEDPATGLMIVDEADELLRGSSCGFGLFGLFGFDTGGKSTEKGVMNSILDEMKLPAVWISNAPAREMDESVRRRFDYSICFERLNSAQRVAIWRNQVTRHKLGGLIPEEKVAEYAVKYETSAGGISTVLENVKRMAPAPEKVDELVATLMKPHCRLMGVKDANAFLPAKDYSLDGLNIKGKVGLERVVKAARNYLDAGFSAAAEDRPRMNVLLYGPPGTGKTEFVKYLGKTLDRKVIVMKGSDILNCYVGETEQNIARAFRRAEAEHAVLFFDEVDGLLQDRSNASRSWEVTQVNELLQQMENFDGIMVAATNFSKNLDPATMRRFTFKLEFGYLDDAGKKSFFERMFKTTLTDGEFAELRQLGNLAPGDFRTVRQGQFYLGDAVTNLDRIAALKEECAVKKDGDSHAPIGFAA
ncbi:MAG: ATP-binding protein [Kiritimatiellae bacterium]|nr:ATP-binding protein [Kiritimatiellia bacterium]